MSHAPYHRPSSLFLHFRLLLSACSLLLVLLLSACSSGIGSIGTGSNTTSDNTPAHLTAYTGDGFSIGSPAGWSIQKAGTSAASVIFIDPTSTIEFTVTVTPNPNGNSATSVALDPRLHSMQSKSHYQPVALASTKTVGGETWDQIGAIGDLPYSGQPLSIKVIALAINRPAHDANTKMYIIQFSAPASGFDQMNSTTFQPMLQSFKFTSGTTGGIAPTETAQATIPINATFTYASVNITIVSAQQATSFADDRDTPAQGVVRLNLHAVQSDVNNVYFASAPVFAYPESFALLLPGGTKVTSGGYKDLSGPARKEDQTTWIDFPAATDLKVDQMILQIGKDTEEQIQVPLTGHADLSQYQLKQSTPNLRVAFGSMFWTLKTVTFKRSDSGTQVDKGKRFLVLTFSLDNPGTEGYNAFPPDFIRLEYGGTTINLEQAVIGDAAAGTTNIPGLVSFVVPQDTTMATFILLPDHTPGATSQVTIPFPIP